MQFGKRVRELRAQQGWTQKELADSLAVSVSYISKVENERLQFGDYPSEKFIHKLADVLNADEEELLLLANKVPAGIKKRVCERPDAFRQLADLDDETLDEVLANLDSNQPKKPQRK